MQSMDTVKKGRVLQVAT